MRALLLIPLLLIVFAVALPTPVLAMDEPDSVSLYEIEIFEDLNVTGDFLAIVPYHIPFTTQPDDAIDDTFLFQIISPDGATINGTSLAYPRYYGGYGYGIVSFYFESGMAWGSAYIFRVQENPAYYPTPLYWDFVVGSSQYSSDTDQSAALRAKIIDTAAELTTIWTVDLLTTDAGKTILSTYGELYYLNAVPGLSTFCPTLFSLQERTVTYTKRSWSYTLADSLQTKYAGTAIGNFMTGYAGLFSMQTSSAMTFLSIILFVIVMMIAVWKFKASMMSAFLDGYAFLLFMMLIGAFNMVYAGLIAFLAVMMGGIVLFLNRS